MKRLTTILLLALAVLSPTAPVAQAVPPDSTPAIVTTSTTNLLFYVYGMLDGQALVAELAKTAPDNPHSLRTLASRNLTMAHLIGFDSTPGLCYFLGVAYALNQAADAAGEPPL